MTEWTNDPGIGGIMAFRPVNDKTADVLVLRNYKLGYRVTWLTIDGEERCPREFSTLKDALNYYIGELPDGV